MTPRTCSTPWRRSCCAAASGPPIRLEITDTTSPFLSQLLADQLGVSQDEVYRLPSPLDLTVLFELGSVDRRT